MQSISNEKGNALFIGNDEVSERMFIVTSDRAVLVEYLGTEDGRMFMVRRTRPTPEAVSFDIIDDTVDNLGRWDASEFWVMPCTGYDDDAAEKVAKRFALGLMVD